MIEAKRWKAKRHVQVWSPGQVGIRRDLIEEEGYIRDEIEIDR